MPHAIDISTVQSVAQVIKKDLLIAPAILTNSHLEQIGVQTITGVTNVQSEFINLGYGGAIRRYDYTKEYTEKDSKAVAKVFERKMKTALSFRPASMNTQEFREKEPFAVTDKVDEANLMRLQQTVFTLMKAARMYGQDVINAFFHAKRSLGDDSPFGIFDGIFALIAKDMTTYTDEDGNSIPIFISKEQSNLINTQPITKPISVSDFSAFDVYESFIESLDSDLTDNEDGVLVLVDKKKAPWIFQAYMNRYPNLQGSVKYEGGYKFFTHDNITLVGSPLVGTTNAMIATRPGNFHLGIESEKDDSNVIVRQSGFDPNKWHMWMQSNQGARLLNPTSAHFAINCDENGALYPAVPKKVGELQVPSTPAGGDSGASE